MHLHRLWHFKSERNGGVFDSAFALSQERSATRFGELGQALTYPCLQASCSGGSSFIARWREDRSDRSSVTGEQEQKG